MKLKNITFLLFTALAFGCKQKVKFDRKSWDSCRNFEEGTYNRDMMVDDLMSSHKFKGMPYKDLRKIIGYPDQADTSWVVYNITEDFGSDIDPVYSKDLYFKLNKDSIITDVKIEEWKKE